MLFVSKLGNVEVGLGRPIRIMGIINLSPESFYGGSVATSVDRAVEMAVRMVEEGADIIDVGGMSTAPYKQTYVPPEVEMERVVPVVKELSAAVKKPISVDTRRSTVAEKALSRGAQIVNDTSGFKLDANMPKVVKEYDASAIVMAYGEADLSLDPIANVRRLIRESLRIAYKHDIDPSKIVVDPGIGFFRLKEYPWYEWDCYVIGNLRRLYTLMRPILIGVSRKSFIGAILSLKDPSERLVGTIAAEAIAAYNGAHAIRTHDVAEAVQAARLAERMRKEVAHRAESGVEVYDLSPLSFSLSDLYDIMGEIGVDEGGVEIMSRKAISRVVLIRNIPRVLAIVLKQEMIATGGDLAIPKDAIFSGFDPTDAILIGTLGQIKRAIEKMKRMEFKVLEERGLVSAKKLATILEDLIG